MISEKTYRCELDKIFECHLVLAGLQELKYNANEKIDKAIMNNLKQLSMHAGQKRLGMGEFYQPSNLLALCQYEFMIKKSLNYVQNFEIKKAMEIAIKKIVEVRTLFACPPFKEKDEIMIVETIRGDKVKAIDPEKLERFKGEFNRLLPIAPEEQFREHDKGFGGFLNYNGDVKETVEYVLKKKEVLP